MAMRWRRRSGDPDDLGEAHEINVTPLIDVVLVLLITFMVAAPLATVDVPVDLPQAAARPQPRPEQPLTLTLKADHSLVLDETPVSREELASAMDRRSEGDHGLRVYLRADRAVDYGAVMDVMNSLRRAGYLKLALVGIDDGEAR